MITGSYKSRGKSRRPMSPQERAQAERDIRGAIADLQESAYANFRSAVANVAIFFGFVGVLGIVAGTADGLRLIPMAVLVLAGPVGVAYYPFRQRWKIAVRLLMTSSTLVVSGLTAPTTQTGHRSVGQPTSTSSAR
ncbi:hypothetical protein ACGFH8_22260 [Micromonospora sp. NPDC049175]|uniref:hypothetical protein n=1 Tax=Micromonospora sp. NPDC049175 TaxID=3364266 RepID=UPI00371AFDA6